MKNVFKFIQLTLIMTLLVLITGCGTKNVEIQDYKPIAETRGLEPEAGQGPGIVLTRPGAIGLEDYNRFIIDPVQIMYSDPKMKELSTDQVARMQQYLQDAVIKQLSDGGYEVGTKSIPGTMRISFTISGLKAPSAVANVTSVLAPIAISVGEVTVEGVFREAVSNRIDAIAVTQARGARFLNASPWSTWADVEASFDIWAKGIREAIDKAHNK